MSPVDVIEDPSIENCPDCKVLPGKYFEKKEKTQLNFPKKFAIYTNHILYMYKCTCCEKIISSKEVRGKYVLVSDFLLYDN